MNFKKPIVLLGAISFLCLMLNTNAYASNSYFLMSCTKQNIPDGYYDSLDTSVSEEMFREDLHDVISANYTWNSYDTAWNIDSYADADPYNEGHIKCLYTGLSVENDSHTSSGDKLYWNREHTWPKSHGFNDDKSAPYTDCHHLRASESKINIAKSNNDFGELDSDYTESYGNRYGNGIFEPNDDVKGDVARMLLYMFIRYGEYDDTTVTINNNTYSVNLELVDNSNTTAISNGNGKLAKLSTILSWHYQDPVSDREIYRNNVVYMFQKNRNPFIDHPEYVEYAFRNSGTYTGNGDIDLPDPDTEEREEEVLVDTIGFENSEGFIANSSNYYTQNTYNTNLSWAGYQASPSTTSAISGSQSLRLSVAKSSTQCAQFFMTEDVYNLSRITFKAKGGSGYQLHVMYSTDLGLSYQDGQTYTLTTTNKSYEFVLSSNGGYDKARIGFYFTRIADSSSYVNIDDLCVYRVKARAEVEFQREKTKASLRYSYVNEYYGEQDIYYERISSLDELTIGSEIIIGALNYNYTMGQANSSNFAAIENEVIDNVINPLTSTVLTVGEGLTDGTISLMVGNKYLGNGSPGNNYLKLTNTLTKSQSWTISLDDATKAVSLTTNNDTDNGSKILRYNSSSKLFSCYSSGQADITIYIKKTGSVTKCNTTISDMNLRFGSVIEKDLYDDILVLDSNALFGVALSKDGINYKNYICNQAIVLFEEGHAVANTLGNYVQWATVIPTDESRYNTVVYAKSFVIINGVTYYMNDTSYSVVMLANYYKTNASSLGLSSEDTISLGGIL